VCVYIYIYIYIYLGRKEIWGYRIKFLSDLHRIANERFAKLARKWEGTDGHDIGRNINLSHENRRKEEEEYVEEGEEETEGTLSSVQQLQGSWTV